MIYLGLALVFFFLILRSGWLGPIVVAFTWLSAGVFNPPISSNMVWFIGCVLGYVAHYDTDS